MKKAILFGTSLALVLSLFGCGGQSSDTPPSASEPVEPLSADEVKKMYSSPKDYKGSFVELSGIVFGGVEYDDDGLYFQMFGDPTNMDMNTLVGYDDPAFELEDDQYVKLTGEVIDVYEGENLLGGKVVAPVIRADSLEISSYIDVVSPTLATAQAATPAVDQHGYVVTIDKAELSATETRLYVSVTNNGSSSFSVYPFNMRIVQDGTQYEETTNFDAGYPELQSDILPGVTTEGIVTFPPLQNAPFTVLVEGQSDDWDEDFKDYTFELAFE